MCLTLNPTLLVPNQPIKVFKLCYESPAGAVTSVYQSMKWDLANKTLFVSSRDRKELTDSEKAAGIVEHGFHVFTDVANALAGHRKDTCVIEFEAKPEHWVAFGTNNTGTAGGVFTELTLSQFLKRRTT